jgi:hypothetical protein
MKPIVFCITVITSLTLLPQAQAKKDTIILKPRVLVVNYDPIVQSAGGQRLHEVCR